MLTILRILSASPIIVFPMVVIPSAIVSRPEAIPFRVVAAPFRRFSMLDATVSPELTSCRIWSAYALMLSAVLCIHWVVTEISSFSIAACDESMLFAIEFTHV